jgi:hypothetical protein
LARNGIARVIQWFPAFPNPVLQRRWAAPAGAEKVARCDLDHTERGGWVVFSAPIEQELTLMTSHFWTRKGLMLSVAIVTLAAIAAALSIGLAYPDPVSSAALGPDWQCTRLAFVLTTCRRLVGVKAANARTDPACPRRTMLIQSEPGGR